jgi:2-(1,2-epoxy-1,2-dihydrophenyl)acetyl-CoA isomerase
VTDDSVLVRPDEHVLYITINRPEVGNAVGPGHREVMIDALLRADRSLAVRAVVITGTGESFCSGADLKGALPDLVEDAPPDAPERPAGATAKSLRRGAQRLVSAVLECGKPVLAAVNGTAAGIGAHLALACDLVIASERARFIEVFVGRGIVPDAGGAWVLPRLVGLQRAKQLVFFGDAVTAEEAARIGLVNVVVPPTELEATTQAWADRLAAGPTTAIGLAKGLLNRSFESDLASALRDEANAVEINKATADAVEGIGSFRERRPPHFKGW